MSLKNVLSDYNNSELVVTKRHDRWMSEGRKITPEAVERVLEVMREDFTGDGRASGASRVRASMIGDACQRKQQLSFLGAISATPTPFMQTVFDIGTFSHYRWQLYGLSAGWLTDIEVSVRTEYGAAGSIDGILENGRPFEFKTINNKSYAKLGNSPLEAHLKQVQVYMDATGADAAHIVYEDKLRADYREFVVQSDPKLSEKLEWWSNVVTGAEEIPPFEACIAQTGRMYDDCMFKEACQPQKWASPRIRDIKQKMGG